MSIVAAVVCSILLLTVTGCVTASDPSAAKQETGKKDSTKKAIKHDEKKTMNEESQDAVH
jgi:Flp pilus assembly protein TadD